jgi:nitroalkane oxidase
VQRVLPTFDEQLSSTSRENAMGIDFTLSEEQVALREGARNFATTVLKDVRKTIRQYSKPDERFYATRPFHRKAVEAGFVKGLFPKEVGGTDVPTLDFALAAEELAAVDVNVPSTLLGTVPLRQAHRLFWKRGATETLPP